MEAEGQEGGAAPVGEESEVADAHEAARQQVEQEAAQELFNSQSHEPLLVAVGGVSPAECHVALGESDQPAVGDSNAMGVGAEIAEYMFRAAERPLGVDDPVVAEQYTQPGGEGARICERQEVSVKLECACMEGVAEAGDELAAEDTAEHLDGKKERAAGGYPGGMVQSDAACGEYAMDMRMKLQPLIPGVEHAEEADLGSEVPWIAGDLKQCLSTGMKEQVEDQPFVLQGERGQFPRQGEDGMNIASGQKFPLARLEPAQARVALAPRAMAISARVVRDGGRMSAAGTAIAMSAQHGGAAARDGQQHLLVLPVHPLATVFKKGLSCTANNVGHLQ